MLRVQQRARERDLALDVARRLGLEQRVERGELRLEQPERARHTRGRVDAACVATVRRGLRGSERAERRGQVVAERHEQLEEGRLIRVRVRVRVRVRCRGRGRARARVRVRVRVKVSA